MTNIVMIIATIVLVIFVVNEGIQLWREINSKGKDEW